MRKATFSYTGIRVKDMDESIRFYVEVLGMEIVSERERLEPTKGEGEELDHLAFLVEDVGATVDELRQEGVDVLVEPGSVGGWAEAFVKDPNGIWIELLPRNPEGA
jgi:catechol 2,3-dioxygenase-like lactoylglutathione lyase family enzyme